MFHNMVGYMVEEKEWDVVLKEVKGWCEEGCVSRKFQPGISFQISAAHTWQ